jgi:hypothetical protein|tara:strand:- start:168 stop:797 length:630 start_codon:yes stop_codon:yes gene_type:complete
MKLEVLKFRKISTKDDYDEKYNDGEAWSRLYEYPLVINEIKKYYKEGFIIHNSCWGFSGIHILFKDELERLFTNVYHSDILKSEFKNTFIYDITKSPKKEEIEKYDILLNVSTLEEVDYNHLNVFNNLFMQLKKGGILISTFDLSKNKQNKIRSFFSRKRKRVLQLEKFEHYFSRKIEIDGIPINGENSIVKNLRYEHLNCGIMVIKKI